METLLGNIFHAVIAFVSIVATFLGADSSPAQKDPVTRLTPVTFEEALTPQIPQKESTEHAKKENREQTLPDDVVFKREGVEKAARGVETQTQEAPDALRQNASAPLSQDFITEALRRMRAPQHEALLPTEDVNKKAREATVNILCLSKSGGFSRPLSGSGVMIHKSGIILTNAHIGQYFLLRNYKGIEDFIDCIIRTGSPARASYRAELLYLPPTWVHRNAGALDKKNPKSSGEHDYAFLRITNALPAQKTMPRAFTALPPSIKDDAGLLNLPAVVAGYAAGFVDGLMINRNLWLTSSTAIIGDVYTFRAQKPHTPDLFGMHGNIVAQEGASGGAVVSLEDGSLVGLIAIRTKGETTGERELRALTMHHIDESMKKHLGVSLYEFLGGEFKEIGAVFQSDVAPALTRVLESKPR